VGFSTRGIGIDADLVLLNEKFEIVHMTAMGEIMVQDKKMLRKVYEK